MARLIKYFSWIKKEFISNKGLTAFKSSRKNLYFSVKFFLFIILFSISSLYAGTFSKLPAGHWAYQAIAELSSAGVISQIDQSFLRGDKPLTRYEFASITAQALKTIGTARSRAEDIPVIEKLTVEFTDELNLLGVRASSMLFAVEELKTGLIKGDHDLKALPGIEDIDSDSLRFSLSGDITFLMRKTGREDDSIEDDWENEFSLGMNYFMNIDKNIFAFMRLQNESVPWNEIGNQENGYIDQLYIDIKKVLNFADMRVGRQYLTLGNSIVLNDKMDGLRLSRNFGNLNFSFFTFTTGNANSSINEQDYGDASGSKNFWIFDDTYNLTGTASKSGTPYSQSSISGSLNNYNTNLYGSKFVPGSDNVTLYTSPYRYPNPFDSTVTNSQTNGVPRVNSHHGIALSNGISRLMPLDAAQSYGLFSGVTLAGNDSDNYEIQDLYSPGAPKGSAVRDWQIQSASGFDSYGLDMNFTLGNQNIGAYFLSRSYNRFDPYTRLGDPWAAMTDSNGDNIIDTDSTGKAKSPEADPWYLGFTFDGEIFSDLNYFFEYVHYEPDITNIGVNPLTGTALSNGVFIQNSLDSGSAWVMGMNYTFAKRLNFLLQYGAGTEEFIPASIYWKRSLNNMHGRLNNASFADSMGRDYDEGTYGLTGIKDFLLKVSADITDKTSGIVVYESVSDYDTTPKLLVSGDYDVTGHLPQDYFTFAFEVNHKYSKNANVKGRYTLFEYEEPALNSAKYAGSGLLSDNIDWGGWSRFEAEIQVTF